MQNFQFKVTTFSLLALVIGVKIAKNKTSFLKV